MDGTGVEARDSLVLWLGNNTPPPSLLLPSHWCNQMNLVWHWLCGHPGLGYSHEYTKCRSSLEPLGEAGQSKEEPLESQGGR